jgi:hypothetical protein
MTAGPLLVAPVGAAAGALLGGCAVLFAVFGVRTALRQSSRVVADEAGLRIESPFARRLAWRTLSGMRLRYFATRRGRGAGWMQLTLRASGVTVRLDSTLEGFPAIVRLAARAAGENGVRFAPGTLDNLCAFGVILADDKTGREGRK